MIKLEADKRLWQFPQAEKYLSTILPRLQEKRMQSFTTLVLLFITLSFFGFFAISPTLSTIADLQKQISDQQFVDQQLQQKITNLSNLEVSYKKIQNDLPVLYAAIPKNPNVTVLIGQMQTIAQKANVTLINVQSLPVDVSQTTKVQYNSFVFTLNVTGSYANISTFLQDVTSFNRIITLEAISLSQINNTDNYNLSLRGDAYFKAE